MTSTIAKVVRITYLCHVLLRFILALNCDTKISEKSDMTKSWAARLCRLPQARTFCCSGTYKKVKLKCCGINM